MWKKLLSILISAAILCGALYVPAFAEAAGESYVFRLSDPENTAELTEAAEVVFAETGLYRTDSYALLRELESMGALAEWDVDCEVTLDGGMADLQSLRTADYRADMLGYSYIREKNITGEGVKVGIIDSGLWSGFSEMTEATILEGVNLLADESSGERSNTEDTVGHGTFVTSIICGTDIGLASGISILPLKCFSEKDTSSSYITAAVYEAITRECDVINLSFGATSDNALLKTALKTALDAGIVVVAAGGNLSGYSTGNDALRYPAAYDGVIGVGSLDSTKTVSNRSAQNASIFVTAPGVSVKGIDYTGSVTAKSGTSYAAPVVTALAALALSVVPEMTGADFADLLAETAEDLGAEGRDNSYGYGLVNPPLLLASLLRDSEGSAVLTVWDGGLGLNMWLPAETESPVLAYPADSRSTVLTAKDGGVGLSMWIPAETGSSPVLACYADSGKLQKLVCPTSLCCFALEDDVSRLTLFRLGDKYQPLAAPATLHCR